MKKRLLSALLSFCMLLTLLPATAQAEEDHDKRTVSLPYSVETSSEPIESAFTDATFLAAVRELIGKTNGEHIYKSDVESITELNISRLDIESLDGIEYFEALTDLICYDNAFVTLDLSNNLNLEVLDCSYCFDLIAINVSNCPELRELDCNNTEIDRLDLRQNPKLKTLYAYETQLRTLNTSNNLLLETMQVWGGHLVNLDVSNNTALTFLDCSYNDLTSLDLSNNPELAWLWCYENYMDTETPDHSIIGLEALRDKLGPPRSNDGTENNYFAYYPQLEVAPTPTPTSTPTQTPTLMPSTEPSTTTSAEPSTTPSAEPSVSPSVEPSTTPSVEPSTTSSAEPSTTPSAEPSVSPNAEPSTTPSVEPTVSPSTGPSATPSTKPSGGSSGGGGGSIPKPAQSQPTPSAPEPTPSAAEPLQPSELVWNPFEDVKLGDWFYNSVKYVYEKAMMEGTSGTTFSPNVDTTRAMIATLLWRMEGSPAPAAQADFPDVVAGQWYTDAVRWAASAGVVKGYDNGNFGPEDTITREQLALMLYRYAEAREGDDNLTAFIDGDSVSDWAVEAVTWAADQGILTGKSGKRLDPQGLATRAETAAMLMRYGENKGTVSPT